MSVTLTSMILSLCSRDSTPQCVCCHGACLEISLSAELEQLAGGVQRLLVVPGSKQRLRIPCLCFDSASRCPPQCMLADH